MISLIFIATYIIISYIVLGATMSMSDTHYGWYNKFGFWGYPIFPIAMIIWATLVIHEAPELLYAAIGIYYVGIFAMFKCSKRIGTIHYLGAVAAIIILMITIWGWCLWVVLSFAGLSLLFIKSKYHIYIIELLAIISLYLYMIYGTM